MYEKMIIILLILPLVGAICGFILPVAAGRFLFNFVLGVSFVTLFVSIWVWSLYCSGLSWVIILDPGISVQGIFNLDGISLVFILLTTFIFPFCILSVYQIFANRQLLVLLCIMEFFLLAAFIVQDAFYFFVLFESLLLPMFFIILGFGARERRVKAVVYFFIYTLLGSIFFMAALFIVYFEIGETSFVSIQSAPFTCITERVLWLFFFLAFASKVPIFPFHIWLPEAHVEAPTVGSVVLAGLLLKLGGYGLLRFVFLFADACLYFQPFALSVCLLSIWLASFMALSQIDVKKIIAYSSIAHMNFALLGIFSYSPFGVLGGLVLFVSHGFVSAALFILIGVLYERFHTRAAYKFGGLVGVMPIFATFFFLFGISNFSFPGTSNFVGELLIFIGLGAPGYFLSLFFGGLSTICTVAYTLMLYNRVFFGNVSAQILSSYTDVSRHEFFMLVPLTGLSFMLGINPNIVLNLLDAVALFIVNY